MNLSPLPIQKFFSNDGRPLVGGKLFTYAAGTSDKIATWKDSSGTSQNTNPVILDFRGEANVWLDPSLTYKFVLSPPDDTDPPTHPIWTEDNIAGAITIDDLTQQFLGRILFPRTPAEIAAGVFPIDYGYSTSPYYDVRRLGALQDGSDQTAIVNQAILAMAGAQVLGVDGGDVFVPQGIGLTLTSLVLEKNVTVLTENNGVLMRLTTGYYAGGAGAVNESWFSAPLHPAVIVDAHDDLTGPALGPGQVLSYRCSFLWAANTTTYWQFSQDIDAVKSKGLCLYANNPSRQFLYFDHISNIRYGRRESIQDFSNPRYPNTLCQAAGIIGDQGGATNPALNLVILQAGVTDDVATIIHQKNWELLQSGVLVLYADDGSTVLVRIDNAGRVRATQGVSGNTFTTAQRNAFSGLTSVDVGTMVYDNTLQIPIWLWSAGPPLVWINATGTAV